MDGDEGARCGPGAGQEERLALLDESRVPVAQGVESNVGPIVSNAHRYGGFLFACGHWRLCIDIMIVMIVMIAMIVMIVATSESIH